jgi:hypothetical protein
MDITMRMDTMMTATTAMAVHMHVMLILHCVNGQNGSQGRAHPVVQRDRRRKIICTGMKNRK